MNNIYSIENQRKTQKERLRFLIEKHLKLTQQKFSDEIDIGQGYISQLLLNSNEKNNGVRCTGTHGT